MTLSSLISAGTAPSSDRDVWAAPLVMQVNWKNPVTVRTGFETRIEQALTLSEQRRLLRGMPRRSISCTLTGTGRVETLAARQLLTRRSMSGFLMPLYSDQVELNSAVTAGNATVSVITTDYRRLFVGNRAVIMSRTNGVVDQFEVMEILSKSSTSITFTSNLTGNYGRDAIVVPLFEATLVDNYSNGFILTDTKADFQNFTAQENVGPTQLEGTTSLGSNPSGFDVFDSLPVFDGPIDYSRIRFGINRIGSFSGVGIAQLPVFYGERGVQRISALLNCTSREAAWDILRFFESRGGRAHPFFLRSPLSDYKVTGSNGNNLLVEDTGDLLDWIYRPYLVMELSNGAYDYRQVDAVVQNGNNHEVSFVGGAPLGTVVGARQLFKMRMFRDEIAERWLTTDCCQMTLEAVEVLEEKTQQMIETMATDTDDSVVDHEGNVISFGTAISVDVTAAMSPDLSLGGCEGGSGGGDCTESSEDCEHCDDLTSEQKEITISGSSLCTCLEINSGSDGRSLAFANGFQVNASHTVVQRESDSCVWQVTYSNALEQVVHTGSADCSGAGGSSLFVDVVVRLTRTLDKWVLHIFDEFGDYSLFLGSVDADTNEDEDQLCASIPAISNELSECNVIETVSTSPVYRTINTSGAATIQCL